MALMAVLAFECLSLGQLPIRQVGVSRDLVVGVPAGRALGPGRVGLLCACLRELCADFAAYAILG